MAVPVLLCGNEAGRCEKDSGAEMKFKLSVKGCTVMDKFRNVEKGKELETCSIEKKYKIRWLEHIQSMSPGRIPKLSYMYRPKGRRDLDRLRNRWQVEARAKKYS
jgi:hypothetical protein